MWYEWKRQIALGRWVYVLEVDGDEYILIPCKTPKKKFVLNLGSVVNPIQSVELSSFVKNLEQAKEESYRIVCSRLSDRISQLQDYKETLRKCIPKDSKKKKFVL